MRFCVIELKSKQLAQSKSSFQSKQYFGFWCPDQCPAFQGISFRDETGRDFSKSRNPGIFRDGISLIFSSRDFLEIVWDFFGLAYMRKTSDVAGMAFLGKKIGGKFGLKMS